MSVQGKETLGKDPQVIHLSGELDAGDPGFADDFLARIEPGRDHVVVDMLDVSFIDSSVIRAMVLAHRQVAATGGWLRVVYTHHLVRRVIEMCGLAHIFPQYPTLEAAQRGTSSRPPVTETRNRRGRPS